MAEPPAGLELRPVTLPDLSLMDEPVREQMRARYSSVAARIEGSAADHVELGIAYGEMGKLFMAAKYLDAAESCFLNALTLGVLPRTHMCRRSSGTPMTNGTCDLRPPGGG